MAVYAPVRADLRQILLSQPNVPAAIAWEGRPFTPTPGIRWIQERLDPIGSFPASLGNEGSTREWMVYTLFLNDPPTSVGLMEQEDFADALRYAYPVGRRIGSVNVNGRVTKSTRTVMTTTPEWRTVSIAITLWVLAATQYNPVP